MSTTLKQANNIFWLSQQQQAGLVFFDIILRGQNDE